MLLDHVQSEFETLGETNPEVSKKETPPRRDQGGTASSDLLSSLSSPKRGRYDQLNRAATFS